MFSHGDPQSTPALVKHSFPSHGAIGLLNDVKTAFSMTLYSLLYISISPNITHTQSDSIMLVSWSGFLQSRQVLLFTSALCWFLHWIQQLLSFSTHKHTNPHHTHSCIYWQWAPKTCEPNLELWTTPFFITSPVSVCFHLQGAQNTRVTANIIHRSSHYTQQPFNYTLFWEGNNEICSAKRQ